MLARSRRRCRRKNLFERIREGLFGWPANSRERANDGDPENQPRGRSHELGSELLEQRFVHPDAALEILNRKIFIRRMRPAIRQSEAT